MNFPNFKDKYKKSSYLTARDFWDYKKEINRIPSDNPPKGVIICYSDRLFQYIIEKYSPNKIENVFGDCFYVMEENNDNIGICGGFGIGAPIVSIILEELNVYGIKNFLSIGTAGALQTNLNLGDPVICNRAIRDEGTSHHYLKPEKYAYPSKAIVESLIKVMEQRKIAYSIGTSWTIDAPYRETVVEVKKYKQENVLTVDMEAAALFAIAQYLNIQAGAIFTISDYLSENKWKSHFHLTDEHLKTLFIIAKETLSILE